MTCRLEEGYQIGCRDRGCHGVDQRVKIQNRVLHHGGIEDDPHGGFRIIDRCERRDRAGSTPICSVSNSDEPKDTRLLPIRA